MPPPIVSALSRSLFRRLNPSRLQGHRLTYPVIAQLSTRQSPNSNPLSRHHVRPLSTSAFQLRGIIPNTESPAEPVEETAQANNTAVASLSNAEYHRLADGYLDLIQAKFLELQDQREDVDVDYSAGVLTVSFAHQGSYVINKQPPNKQIWLSSPISGPSRYDYVVKGEGQSEKADTATGHWINARDGSTLDAIFFHELGLDLSMPPAQYS